MVESYKYLECIVNERMDCREMVKERAEAGRGALSAWLWRCRASMGEVEGNPFVKLGGVSLNVWGRSVGKLQAAGVHRAGTAAWV